MSLAQAAAERSTCPRARVGAVVVKDRQVIATGYNGSASGEWHCLDENVGCEMVGNHCIRTIHAEANAITYAGYERTKGATLYCTHLPCWACSGMIINAGIEKVVYRIDYSKSGSGLSRLKNAGIRIEKLDNGCGKERNRMEGDENV
jgi:dCMP deaminase